MPDDLAADFELLLDDGIDALLVRQLDDRAHLGTEDALWHRAAQQRVELGHRLHHLHAVGFVGEPFVDFEQRHHPLFRPEEFGAADAVDVAVHRAFEEDGAEHSVAIERTTLDHPRAHRMDEIEHLRITRILRLGDAVERERFWRAASALVECGDEALAQAHALALFGVRGHAQKNSVSV